MASRSLDDLDPRFRPMAEAFLANLKSAGVDVVVICTLRTMNEQQALYDQGRTKPGPVVTRAKPGSSAHNYGLAMDCCPLLNGKLAWSAPDGDSVADAIWQQYGAIARQTGLEWGGDWVGFAEGAHVQYPKWKEAI